MSYPLLEQLHTRYNYPSVTTETVEEFIKAEPYSVLFFVGDPKRFPEALDVAVILPELVKVFPMLKPAVVTTDSEKALQGRYNFNTWPTLVFLKEGGYLGALSRVHNWDDYCREIADFLTRKPQRNPGIGIPVVSDAQTSDCSH